MTVASKRRPVESQTALELNIEGGGNNTHPIIMEKELKERKEIIIVKKKGFGFSLSCGTFLWLRNRYTHTHTHACSTNKTHFANLQDSRFNKQKRNEMGNVNSC